MKRDPSSRYHEHTPTDRPRAGLDPIGRAALDLPLARQYPTESSGTWPERSAVFPPLERAPPSPTVGAGLLRQLLRWPVQEPAPAAEPPTPANDGVRIFSNLRLPQEFDERRQQLERRFRELEEYQREVMAAAVEVVSGGLVTSGTFRGRSRR